MRAVIGVFVVFLSLLVVPAAWAATEDYLDRDHGVRFIVDGPVLTLRLEPQAGQRPPDVRADVWGRQVQVACSPLFNAEERRLLRAVVAGELLWPDGQLEVAVTFDRDISNHVKWCVLEVRGGEDAAGAMFEPFIRVFAGPIRERRMGWALRRYIRSREEAEAWLPEAFAIAVMRGGRMVVGTGLRRNAGGRRIARRLCALVRDSRVPLGPTAVYGRSDTKLRSCHEAQRPVNRSALGHRVGVGEVKPPEP